MVAKRIILLFFLLSLVATRAYAGPAAGQWVGISDANGNSLGTASGIPVTANSPANSACKTVTVNASGAGNADITVDNTAGGVTVLAASATACGAIIENNGTADMRCGPTSIVITTTVGFDVPPGKSLVLGLEGQQAWKCIRTTAVSTTASVAQATP